MFSISSVLVSWSWQGALTRLPHNFNRDQEMSVKKYKEPIIRVNICWQIGDDKKCVTLPKEHAYETRDWVESQGGCVFWFQALPD
jgi:hypothetical protein